MSATDMLDRELHVGDYVVFHNLIYQVVSVPDAVLGLNGHNYIKVMLWHPSKTTKPVRKYSKFMCKIPSEDMTAWKLKQG
jgi:hypothetical protein